jgi:hypothetical protein
MDQFFKRLLPAQYASKSFKLNVGKCREFMSTVHDNQQIVLMKKIDLLAEKDGLKKKN